MKLEIFTLIEKHRKHQALPCWSSFCNSSFLFSSNVACAAATVYCTACSTNGFLDSLNFFSQYNKHYLKNSFDHFLFIIIIFFLISDFLFIICTWLVKFEKSKINHLWRRPRILYNPYVTRKQCCLNNWQWRENMQKNIPKKKNKKSKSSKR